jgi:hypothetical protein
MLQSIKRALKLDPEHPKLKKFLELFHEAMETRYDLLLSYEIMTVHGQCMVLCVCMYSVYSFNHNVD